MLKVIIPGVKSLLKTTKGMFLFVFFYIFFYALDCLVAYPS